MNTIDTTAAARPELALSSNDAFFILMKAREFDGKTPDSDPDSGSDAVDEGAVEAELDAAIGALSDDAMHDLIALIWVGRGDFTLADWTEARAAARDIGRERAPRYVRGIPLVSDYLDEALSQMGLSLEDYMQ